ncbi:MAG: hypothetical protein ACJA2S_002033 [Cyclobacteriaceae bacterium]|jgi:hypothetical protein
MDKTYKILEAVLKTCAFVVIIEDVLKIVHVPGTEAVFKTGIYGGITILIYQNNKLKSFIKSALQTDKG